MTLDPCKACNGVGRDLVAENINPPNLYPCWACDGSGTVEKEKGAIAVAPQHPHIPQQGEQMSKTIVHNPERRDHELARKEAEAAECGYEGCDGLMHEAFVDPSKWHHQVRALKFDGGIIEASISRTPEGTYEGDIYFGGDGTMTAAEFRTAASNYEAFPAWLLDFATRLDALNGAN